MSKVQQKAGWHHVHGWRRQRCPQGWVFFRSQLLPQGLGHHLADSWRKNCLESLVPDLGKTRGYNAELCPVASIRQNPLWDWGGVVRQNLVPL